MENNQLHMTVKEDGGHTLLISFSNRLDSHTVASLWRPCLDLQSQHQPEILNIDIRDVSYCDGAGMALLLELKRRQLQINKTINIRGLNSWLENLLQLVEQPIKPMKEEEFKRGVAETVGMLVVRILKNVRENIIFIGKLSVELWRTLKHLRTIRWCDFWRTIEEVGPNALSLIAMIGFLVGLISTFQSAEPMGRFGTQIYIINLVSLGLIREMGPLMSAVLLAGRTASAFAAELGTMKINQEIDALTTMGLDPMRFLVIPRILATTLMAPFLNIFLVFFGLIGCGIVMYALGYNFDIYLNQLYNAIDLRDIFGGMVKTFAFGFVIACVGCLYGLKTRISASAVGFSTTQAVVSSIIMIVLVDGVFACIYYVLGV
jgi:phospholipid/cholesterol/gamma-HCH transport system permease protein